MKKYHNSKLQTNGKSVLESPGQNVLMPPGRIIRSIIHTISAYQLRQSSHKPSCSINKLLYECELTKSYKMHTT